MRNHYTLEFDGNEGVKFTPEGLISILDALRFLGFEEDPVGLWNQLQFHHPQLLNHCQMHVFPDRSGDKVLPVMDKEGWQKTLILLPKYLLREMDK